MAPKNAAPTKPNRHAERWELEDAPEATESPESRVSPEYASANSRLSRHERKCIICRHPDRAEIEDMFVHWHNTAQIASRFGIAGRSSIYRHSHATGLFARRQRNLYCALEHVASRSGGSSIKAGDIIRAVQIISHLPHPYKNADPVPPDLLEQDDGDFMASRKASGALNYASKAAPELLVSNRDAKHSQNVLTNSKQRSRTNSNRNK